MIRVEYLSKAAFEAKPKSGTFCEDTLDNAKASVKAMADNGIKFIEIRYYDRNQRLADIRAGNFHDTPEAA